MSDETPRLKLAQLVSLQELNAVTWNEALMQLDTLVDLRLDGRDVNAPPSAPAEGDTYLIGGAPSGEWAAYSGKLACWRSGGWQYFLPFKGLMAYLPSAPDMLIYDGQSWVSLATVLLLQNIAKLGIACSADATNRLAVSSSAILFNHAGAGLQLKLNKNAAGNTASVLYQTNWSGRAEFGTCGDDHFHLKTSPDGSVWRETLHLKTSGEVGVGKVATGGVQLDVAGPIGAKSYTVSTVPGAAVQAGQIIYVTNESGGAVLAFSDGSAWRRVTDRAVIS